MCRRDKHRDPPYPAGLRPRTHGRSDAEIRVRFLEVLHEAIAGGERSDSTSCTARSRTAFHPLDGQQRLTTLFLLHWYLGYRAERLDAAGMDPLLLCDTTERAPVLRAARRTTATRRASPSGVD